MGATDNYLYGSQSNFENAQNACPNGWRIPTKDELESLSANYSPETIFNGLKGRWFSGSRAYSSLVPAIFLPYIDWHFPSDGSTYGLYWSSMIDSAYDNDRERRAYGLYFNSEGTFLGINSFVIRETTTVRCIKE